MIYYNLKEEYEKGKSLRQLEKELGINRETIRIRLKQLGVRMRKSGDWKTSPPPKEERLMKTPLGKCFDNYEDLKFHMEQNFIKMRYY